MSLFQCDKCGCLENTACTNFSHVSYMINRDTEKIKAKKNPTSRDKNALEAFQSYKQILGIPENKPFGKYCSSCTPLWYTKEGGYGVGPNPEPKKEEGLWHDVFARRFYPKGKMFTDKNGNLAHVDTGSDDIRKFQLEKEDGT